MSNKNIVQFGCIHNLVVTLLIQYIGLSLACPSSNSNSFIVDIYLSKLLLARQLIESDCQHEKDALLPIGI